MGEIKGPEFYRQLYSVDAVHYADELLAVLKGLKPPALHLLHGQNTDRCCSPPVAVGGTGVLEWTLYMLQYGARLVSRSVSKTGIHCI